MNPSRIITAAFCLCAPLLTSIAAEGTSFSLSDPNGVASATSLSDETPPAPNYLDRNGGTPHVRPLYDPSVRNSALREMCGGPFYDLSSADGRIAAEFSNGILDALVATHLSNGEKLTEIYRSVLEPKIHYLKDGTKSQRQLYAASEALYAAAAYASNNDPVKGPWPDQKLNGLLRLKPPGTTSKQVVSGISELRDDYFQLADPEAYKMHLLHDESK